MDSTSINLLRRLKAFDDSAAWERFLDLYSHLIYFWLRRSGLRSQDAADLLQDILLTVVQKIKQFEYDPKQKFRGWLRTVTVNRATDFRRRNARQVNSQLDATVATSLVAPETDFWTESEYRRILLLQALQLLKSEFPEKAWNAARLQLVEGKPAAMVAKELAISVNWAYLAKSRLLARLRQELDGLMD